MKSITTVPRFKMVQSGDKTVLLHDHEETRTATISRRANRLNVPYEYMENLHHEIAQRSFPITNVSTRRGHDCNNMPYTWIEVSGSNPDEWARFQQWDGSTDLFCDVSYRKSYQMRGSRGATYREYSALVRQNVSIADVQRMLS